MKTRILSITLTACAVSATLWAQTSSTTGTDTRATTILGGSTASGVSASSDASNTIPSMPDGVSMSGGIAMITRAGESMKVTKEMTLANDIRVRPDGRVLLADGTSQMLHEGQTLTLDGRIVTAGATNSTTAARATGATGSGSDAAMGGTMPAGSGTTSTTATGTELKSTGSSSTRTTTATGGMTNQ